MPELPSQCQRRLRLPLCQFEPPRPRPVTNMGMTRVSNAIDKASLQWRHNGRDGVSNQQHRDCLLNILFRCRSKKKLRVTGLCEGNPPVTGEFSTQRNSITENVSIWWCHYVSSTDHDWQGATSTYIFLTHWGRDKINAILQTTFSDASSWMKMFEFWLKFHLSLFLKVQLTIFQHWFR